jgi:hypothetical protein
MQNTIDSNKSDDDAILMMRVLNYAEFFTSTTRRGSEVPPLEYRLE